MSLRLLIVAMLAIVPAALTGFHSVDAADATQAAPHTIASQQQEQQIDDNDDTRVEVQLVVLGIAAGTVLVLGSCIYLLRKRLGLGAPPPEEAGDVHH